MSENADLTTVETCVQQEKTINNMFLYMGQNVKKMTFVTIGVGGFLQ